MRQPRQRLAWAAQGASTSAPRVLQPAKIALLASTLGAPRRPARTVARASTLLLVPTFVSIAHVGTTKAQQVRALALPVWQESSQRPRVTRHARIAMQAVMQARQAICTAHSATVVSIPIRPPRAVARAAQAGSTPGMGRPRARPVRMARHRLLVPTPAFPALPARALSTVELAMSATQGSIRLQVKALASTVPRASMRSRGLLLAQPVPPGSTKIKPRWKTARTVVLASSKARPERKAARHALWANTPLPECLPVSTVLLVSIRIKWVLVLAFPVVWA